MVTRNLAHPFTINQSSFGRYLNLSHKNIQTTAGNVLCKSQSYVIEPSLLRKSQMLKSSNISSYIERYCSFGQPDIDNRHIDTLVNDAELIITHADKGNIWVLQNTTNYVNECWRQLSNTQFYCKLSPSQHKTNVARCIIKLCKSMLEKGVLTSQEYRRLIFPPGEFRPRQFYILPKTHKDPHK